MKLWELDSVFREDRAALKEVLKDRRWEKYSRDFAQIKELINKQDRARLDQELPEALVLEALQHLNLTFIIKQGFLRTAEDGQGIPAVEIARLFGGGIIEDVLERGCVALPDAAEAR